LNGARAGASEKRSAAGGAVKTQPPRIYIFSFWVSSGEEKGGKERKNQNKETKGFLLFLKKLLFFLFPWTSKEEEHVKYKNLSLLFFFFDREISFSFHPI
jgi:hypothetical protein